MSEKLFIVEGGIGAGRSVMHLILLLAF